MKKTALFAGKLLMPVILMMIIISCNRTDLNKSGITISSPNQNLQVKVRLSDNKTIHYSVTYGEQIILQDSKLGLTMEDNTFVNQMDFVSATQPKTVTDEYSLKTGKRKQCYYEATEQTLTFENENNIPMQIVFSISNNGVAFLYHFPEKTEDLKKISSEESSFKFADGTIGWLSPMSVAKTGWCETNNSYEEHYEFEIKPGTQSPLGAGWVYPALFKTNDVWTLISEADLGRDYCGTRLISGKDENEYKIGFPNSLENFPGGATFPESALPWSTPWRLMAIGSLSDVIESTLGTDLAEPAIDMDFSFVEPGIASWSWIIEKDESVNYEKTHSYIDLASDMNWKYCLVDADWDRKIGYERIKELSEYAQSKNVRLLLWYNSSGEWNSTTYSPKSALLTSEARQAEFKRIKEMGIAGIKVDFFGGDGQSMIAYYHDIFIDAAKYGLMVNCHGATLPRGWHRTYPNLLTMEAVKGMEFITFDQNNANKAPEHCVMQIFTRNVFDPMDFTPMNLSGLPRINRVTSPAFELALPILFTSGIQHLAETPAGMKSIPEYVKIFLQNLPKQWIDTKLIDGYPGKYAILARKAESGWYIAGINAGTEPKELNINLDFIPKSDGLIITDGNENGFVKASSTTNQLITMQPNGGFVMFFPSAN